MEIHNNNPVYLDPDYLSIKSTYNQYKQVSDELHADHDLYILGL